MKTQMIILFLLVTILAIVPTLPLKIPKTPALQTSQCISSIDSNPHNRIYVDYLLPLPPETSAADIDPWPGGLNQMYDPASSTVKQILNRLTPNPGKCTEQIISKEDCCSFLVQEDLDSSKNDIACVIFPSVDNFNSLQEIDNLVGDRKLLLFNRQFKRPQDFGFDKTKAEKEIFNKYKWGYALQEFAVRGEDCKLIFENGTWNAVCLPNAESDEEIVLFDEVDERPEYVNLEIKINELIPKPLWMRQMDRAENEGFKFNRKK